MDANQIIKIMNSDLEQSTKIETILKSIPEIKNRPDNIVNYHQERILYKKYKKENLDIGSGVIESGNKKCNSTPYETDRHEMVRK